MIQDKLPPCSMEFLISQTRLMLSSYKRWLGRSLWPDDKPDQILVQEVFFAPFALCSAGTEKDPILNYGNQTALDLWEMSWEKLTQTPGRYTAEAMEREERARFLKTVREQGYVDNYRGIRISSTGKRFEIHQAIVWNLVDEKGKYHGQAATFSEWRRL